MKYGNETEFDDSINANFNPSVILGIVTSLERAYSSALDNYDVSKGSNEGTFGYDIYNFVRHELIEYSRKSTTSLLLKSKAPLFRMKIGDFEVSCHRVGEHEHQHISNCFPNTDGPVHYKKKGDSSEQLSIPNFYHGKEHEWIPFNVVLAHLGNCETGLRAIYICRPGNVNNEKITSWEYSKLLWRIDESTTNKIVADRVFHAEETIGMPIVSAKDDEKQLVSENKIINIDDQRINKLNLKAKEKNEPGTDG